jgi:Na+/H+ antiporter NhaD/arsenite permease-like protein
MATSNDGRDHLNGHSGFILAVFCVVSVFVIWPVKIPLAKALQQPLLLSLRKTRIIGHGDFKALSTRRLYLSLSLLTAPFIGVILLLATTTINGSTIRLGIVGDETIKPYDVLVLFIALAYIAIALDGTGALEAVAFYVSKRGGSSGRLLFTYLYGFFLLTACIVGNDPLILSGTPFLAYLTSHTGLEPSAWVFSEFMAANTASAVLVSSNPTNILITGSFGLNFLTGFTKWTVLPSLIPAALNYPVILAMFWNRIPKTLTPVTDDPWSKLRDRTGAIFLSVLLLVTVAVLVGTSFVPHHAVEVWMVTAPAGILGFLWDLGSDWFRPRQQQQNIIRRQSLDQAAEMQRVDRTASNGSERVPIRSAQLEKPPTPPSAPLSPEDKPPASQSQTTLLSLLRHFDRRFPATSRTIQRLPIPLLPFAMCEFILVRGLAQRGWISVFASGFANACTTPARTVFFMGFVSAAFLCPLAGTNIGATIILVEILRDANFSLSEAVLRDKRVLPGAIYAVAMGSNIGAFSYTFAGSLAGLLWRGLLSDKGIHISQLKFALVNAIPLLMQITVSSAIILGQLYWFI